MMFSYTVNIENNIFRENLAGSKGTALFIKNINSVRIHNCSFDKNGPLLSSLEINKSPYVNYLSNRSIVFTDKNPECQNEFEYMSNCYDSLTLPMWSHINGAVYVEHCQTD